MSSGEFRFVFYPNNYEATVAFYGEDLGLPIVGGWDRGPDDRGTLFGAAAGIIEVVYRGDHEFTPPVGAWLLFQVDDVDELHRRVKEERLPVKLELTNRPWGHREFQVTDPNGIVVAVFSKIG